MHIPDGFIPFWQCAIYYVILIIALYFATKWARQNLDEKRIPLLAVLAAGIFAIMSMNIPIPFGTSGHMVGGALVAIIFCAPEAAVLVFTVVLLIQALVSLKGTIGIYGAAGVGAWLATVVAALACAIEMAIAGTFPLTAGIASMVTYHIFIGIIEAVLTVIVLMALDKFRPDLLIWNKNKIEGGE